MAQQMQEQTGWTGWIVFAGVMMVIAGGLGFFHGLVAAVNDEWVVWGPRASVYLDLSTWGWIHMIVGLVVLLAGVGVMTGNVLARTVGVILAVISLFANFAWLPVFPVWSVIVITVDVLVIWALTAHGAEMRTPAN